MQLSAGKKKTVKVEALGTEEGISDQSGNGSSALQNFWYALLPENAEVRSGSRFTWTLEVPSEAEYEQMIPLGALHEGIDGTYCLVLAEEKRMSGTVQTAKRVPVTVLEKDAKSAAVTSPLKGTDQVIVSSEKYVTEGDRVQVKE